MEVKFEEKGLNIASNSREPAGDSILEALYKGGIANDANRLSTETGYPVSTVRKWLNILKREGLVVKRKVGNKGFFYLRGKVKSSEE